MAKIRDEAGDGEVVWLAGAAGHLEDMRPGKAALDKTP
jgi:hypothetical protein